MSLCCHVMRTAEKVHSYTRIGSNSRNGMLQGDTIVGKQSDRESTAGNPREVDTSKEGWPTKMASSVEPTEPTR